MGKIYKHEDDSDDESQTPITPLTDMLLVRKKKKKKKKHNESEIDATASFLQEEQVPSKIKKSKVVDQGGLNNNNNSQSLEDFETPVKKKKKKKSKEYLSSPEEAVAKDKMETPVKKKNKKKHKELLSPSEEEAVVKDQRKVSEDTPKKKKRRVERDVSPESTPEKKKQRIEENGVKKKKTKNETEELLVTPLKKKKKKKRTEEAEEILDTPEKVSKIEDAPEEQLSEDASNTSISPENGTRRRRLSRRLQDRSHSEQSSRRNSLQFLPEDEKDSSEDYDSWKVEDEKLLVEKVLSVLGPKTKTVTYNKQLNQFDWNAIHLEKHDSADCKKKFVDLLKNLVKVKSLQALGEELRDFFNDPKKMKASIATPFQRFHKSLRLRPGAICNTTPREQWKNLPQEVKDVFINAYKKELAKYNLSYAPLTSKMSGINTVSLMKPVDFYVDHGLKTEGTHRTELKKMYSSLSQEEKLPYIEEAIKVYVEYMEDAMKKEEDSDNRKGLRIYGLTKTDMKFYLKSKGVPERPQKPPLMYIKMLESQGKKVPALKNLLIDAQRIFAHIKEKEKKKYINIYQEALKNYKERMGDWKKKQDPSTLAILDIIYKEDSKDMKRSVKKKSNVLSNRVATSQSKPLFIGEPVLPATSGLKYFSDIFNQQHSSAFRSKSERNEVRTRKWEKYSEEKRQIYEDKCKEAIQEYKSKVLDYVGKMSDKEARIYLGFQRESICSHLKEDIFEDTYPNADYPIFTVNRGAKFNISTDDDDDFINNEVALKKETEKNEDFDEEELVKSHKKTDSPRHQSKDEKNTKKKKPSSRASEKGHMKQQAQKKAMSSEDSDESDVDNGNAAGSNIPVNQSDSDSEDSKDDDATDDDKDDDDDDVANVTPAWHTSQSRGFVISKDGSEDSEDDSDDSSSD